MPARPLCRRASALGLTVAAVLAWMALPAAADPLADATDSCFLLCSPTPTTTPPPPETPVPAPAPAPPVTTPPAPAPPVPLAVGEAHHEPAAAARLLELINRDRAANGAAPLVARGDVLAVAVEHSKAMLAKRTIYHNDAYFTSASHTRLGARLLAENVAFNSSVDDTHTRLMNSPGHRTNILDKRLSVIGIGVVTDGLGVYYTTQDFLQPLAGAVAAPLAAVVRPPRTTPRVAPLARSTPAAAVALVHRAPDGPVAAAVATVEPAPPAPVDTAATRLAPGSAALFDPVPAATDRGTPSRRLLASGLVALLGALYLLSTIALQHRT